MKKLRIKTPKVEIEAQDVPPWLAAVAIAAVVLVVVLGAWGFVLDPP